MCVWIRCFKKQREKHPETKKSALTVMYKWCMGSRWYTPYLHIATIDIWAFIAPCHQGFYHGVEEIAVMCLQPGGNILFRISVFCKSLARQVLRTGSVKLDITGLHTAHQLGDATAGKLWATLSTVPTPRPIIFLLLNHLQRIWLASGLQTDADVKQAVTS